MVKSHASIVVQWAMICPIQPTWIYSIINHMGILEYLEAYLELDDFIDLTEDIDKIVD